MLTSLPCLGSLTTCQYAPHSMARISRRQVAIRRHTRQVRLLTYFACFECVGLMEPATLEAFGNDIQLSLFRLLRARRHLRTLLSNRYLDMSRGFFPKSNHWAFTVLNVLPKDQFRLYMRVNRSTYTHLGELLIPLLPRRCRLGRPCLPADVVMKIGLFRLGHYGNATCTWLFNREHE